MTARKREERLVDTPVKLRLQSGFEGPFNFMVGGFYEDMERDLDAPVQILPQAFYPPGFMPNPDPGPYQGSFLNYHQHWDNNIESWSVFGSFDYRFAEQWSLSGGLRYTEEDRDSFGGNLYERGLGFSPGSVGDLTGQIGMPRLFTAQVTYRLE